MSHYRHQIIWEVPYTDEDYDDLAHVDATLRLAPTGASLDISDRETCDYGTTGYIESDNWNPGAIVSLDGIEIDADYPNADDSETSAKLQVYNNGDWWYWPANVSRTITDTDQQFGDFGNDSLAYWEDLVNGMAAYASIGGAAQYQIEITDGTNTSTGYLGPVVSTLGAELLSNLGLETLGAGGGDIFEDWTEIPGDGTIFDETGSVHGGSHAIKLVTGAGGGGSGNQPHAYLVTVTPQGSRNRLSYWTRGDGTYAGYISCDAVGRLGGGYARSTGVTGTSYAQVTEDGNAIAADQPFFVRPDFNVSGAEGYFDDVSLKRITGAGLAVYTDASLTTRGWATNNVDPAAITGYTLTPVAWKDARDGSPWNWMTETEAQAGFAAGFTLADKNIRVACQLNGDGDGTPTVRAVNLLATLDYDVVDDIITGSLVPTLAALRPVVPYETLAKSATDTFAFDEDDDYEAEHDYDWRGVHAAYNLTDDPDQLTDIKSTWTQGTKTLTLTAAAAEGDVVLFIMEYAPAVVFSTSTDYELVQTIPEIRIGDFGEEERRIVAAAAVIWDQKVDNQGTQITCRSVTDWEGTINFLAPSFEALSHLASVVRAHLENNDLMSAAIGQEFRCQMVGDLNPIIVDAIPGVDMRAASINFTVQGMPNFSAAAETVYRAAGINVTLRRCCSS